MPSAASTDLVALVAAAQQIGARPYKDATGNWSTAVEVALLDTVMSTGAVIDGIYGAGVLPRLRAFKAFRGPANMMRVVATLGPLGLADFVADKQHMDLLLATSARLLDAGIHAAGDVDVESASQREALVGVDGMSSLAWEYFLISLGREASDLAARRAAWLDAFVSRATGQPALDPVDRDALLAEATIQLDAEHQRKSFGRMPTFTVPLLHQAIFRSEYARATA